mmetsp:Transcript_41336/g.46995  ORF Transcript_41336/g.46995 Transcript_41336/m.46995 type:complete len:195 (-) Transcript_41336:103-687(-)
MMFPTVCSWHVALILLSSSMFVQSKPNNLRFVGNMTMIGVPDMCEYKTMARVNKKLDRAFEVFANELLMELGKGGLMSTVNTDIPPEDTSSQGAASPPDRRRLAYQWGPYYTDGICWFCPVDDGNDDIAPSAFQVQDDFYAIFDARMSESLTIYGERQLTYRSRGECKKYINRNGLNDFYVQIDSLDWYMYEEN